jgi:hypothetical protein
VATEQFRKGALIPLAHLAQEGIIQINYSHRGLPAEPGSG